MADDEDWMRPPFDPIALAEGFAWPWKGTPEQSYEVTYVTVAPPPPRGPNPGKSTLTRAEAEAELEKAWRVVTETLGPYTITYDVTGDRWMPRPDVVVSM